MENVQIVLYTTKTCPYSWEMRQHLQERGLDFNELFIDESDLAAKLLQQMVGDQVVPVTVVSWPDKSDEVIVGFDRQKLDATLGFK